MTQHAQRAPVTDSLSMARSAVGTAIGAVVVTNGFRAPIVAGLERLMRSPQNRRALHDRKSVGGRSAVAL